MTTLVEPAARTRTATDIGPLGRDRLPISRLGLGTGSDSGNDQRALGREAFTRLVHYAYERGIRYIDTADGYRIHDWVRDAIAGLPREELFLQTKMPWDNPTPPEKPLEVLERYLKELGVEYIDSLLIHCTTNSTWPTDLRPMMDAFADAKQRGLIRAHGVSCHGLPALRAAEGVEWIDIQLARVNPQGRHCDGLTGRYNEAGIPDESLPIIERMHEDGRGVIAMKLIGSGEFKSLQERELAVRHAMQCGYVDAVVIGFTELAHVDEAINLMNSALAD